MKRFILIVPLVSLFFPSTAFAEVSVNVSNNSNVSQQSSTKTTTDIEIETNGEVKKFHTEGNEDINWTSDDGKSSVKINTQASTDSTVEKNDTTVKTTKSDPLRTDIKDDSKATASSKTDIDLEKILKDKIDLPTIFLHQLDYLQSLLTGFWGKVFHK